MPRFGVVIPYFQREPGLLARAVRSVISQVGVQSALIVIVDDGSPHPAVDELANFTTIECTNIKLIKQKNGGVSNARNRALEELPENIDFVAFLDPDDIWESFHLYNASIAFNNGADFYFSDFRRLGSELTRFQRSNLDLKSHKNIENTSSIYEYNGNFRNDIIKQTMVGTSTVVLKRVLCKTVKIYSKITASEDILYWFMATKTDSRIFFSSVCEVIYGEGVGLIASSTWGSLRSIRVASDQAAMLAIVQKSHDIDREMKSWIKHEKKMRQADLFRTLLHRLRRKQKIDYKSVFNIILMNPNVFPAIYACLSRN